MARRSVLFSPGDRPELMRKAPRTDADVFVFDLEDAVAPDRKEEAREAVNEVLADPDFDPDAEVCVRVNPIAGAAEDDLDAVLDGLDEDELDSVMLPKATEGEDIERLGRLLDERSWELPVLALIESARGVLNAPGIADATPTDALIFGAEDLAADLGATRTREGTEVLYARERVVLAASAAGIDAIDTVFTDFEDEEGLREDTDFAIQLGFDGKLAIHPAQVPVVNEAYTPADGEIEWARRVVEANEQAEAEGRGVFEVDGEMIDAPLIAQAERIIERGRAAEK